MKNRQLDLRKFYKNEQFLMVFDFLAATWIFWKDFISNFSPSAGRLIEYFECFNMTSVSTDSSEAVDSGHYEKIIFRHRIISKEIQINYRVRYGFDLRFYLSTFSVCTDVWIAVAVRFGWIQGLVDGSKRFLFSALVVGALIHFGLPRSNFGTLFVQSQPPQQSHSRIVTAAFLILCKLFAAFILRKFPMYLKFLRTVLKSL